MRKHHYRIVNPIRFFLFIIISVFIIIFAGYSLMSSSSTVEAVAADTYVSVVVQENDNLWDLASAYNPDRADIREIVYEIYNVNDIEQGDMLHPGQKILIPVY